MEPMKQCLILMVLYYLIRRGSAQNIFSPTCGLPQPTTEQQQELNDIPQDRIDAIRARLLQSGPILESVQDNMSMPLVSLTEEQTALLFELYGDNGIQFEPAATQKRAISNQNRAACSGNDGFTQVAFAFDDAGDIIQLNGIPLPTSTDCFSNSPACTTCCSTTICVPVVGLNIDRMRVQSFNVMLNRCNCCVLPLP